MRTNLFLSTLFAVSLVGGVALAEKPHDGSQARAPRAIENLRAHGDMVDKSYTSADKGSVGSQSQSMTQVAKQSHTRSAIDKGASRINCSESGADCSASQGSGDTHANGLEAGASQHGVTRQAPAFLDKILGSDRTNFNEAGEDEGMSPRAVKRAWSHAGHGSAASNGAIPLSLPKQAARLEGEASSDRMSCNDADECMMSSKAAKKDGAYAAIKAGTWKGPEAPQPSNAARAIAEQKASESKAAAKTAEHAAGQVEHVAQHESDEH